MIDSVNPIRFDRPAQRLMQACCVLRRCGLLLLVVLFCLLSQQRTVQAQSNNPPQVEPVADREMYVDDEIQINLDASDP
ncbi:MAG: hypothetical protein KDE19_14670, partial [Caldilineaceae bacterium]|nr:hypothetical protein [Caldilineaceae bacterium]